MPCYTIGIITSYRYIEKGQSFYWAMYERVLFHLSQGNHIAFWKSFQNPLNKPVQCPV